MGDANLRVSVTYCYTCSGQWPVRPVPTAVVGFSMIRIEDICEKERRNHPQADLNLLRSAYLFSARLHNMRTLEYLNAEKRRRIAQETMDIYAPIAHRLGMGKLRGELEDLSFKHLHADDYRDLTAQLEKRRAANEAFLNDVTTTIQQEMEKAEVPFLRLEGRVKRLYSIWKKLQTQTIDLD